MSVTRLTTLFDDGAESNVYEPGDILLHTITISNTGDASATGLTFEDTLDGSTLLNVSPVAFNDSYTAVGNTLLEVGNATVQTGPQSSYVGGSVLGNDVEFLSDTYTISAFTPTSANGGTVSMVTTGVDAGSFTYVSAPGFTGTDSFTYTIKDDGADGIANNADDLSSTATVTITVAGQVWYVDNSHTGLSQGTSTNPFKTLAEAEAASDDNDTVYVRDGDNTTTGLGGDGYTMNAGERLIGEHTGLTIDQDGAGGQYGTISLHAGSAGAHPTLTATGGDVITLAAGATVDGITVDANTGFGGISGTGAAVSSVTIANVRIVDTGTAGTQAALELTNTTGTHNISNLVIDNTAATGETSGSVGVLLSSAGTVNFASAGEISIKIDGARGLDATGTNLDGSTFDSIIVAGSGTGGVSLANTTGTTHLGDGSGTDLSLTTTGGTGLSLNNAGTVNVAAAGTDSVNATNGTAVDVQNTTANMAFDTVSSATSAGDGVNLSGGTVNFSADGGTISGALGISFDINAGGTGTITYAGNLNDGEGGTAVEITGRTGGAITFSGQLNDDSDTGGGINIGSGGANTGGTVDFTNATKVLNTGDAAGVTVLNSDGMTVNFTGGGLDIDTTTGTGFTATTSGTVTVTGTGNTIDSTSGSALIIRNTDIGAADVTFQRVSSGQAAVDSSSATGIILDTTGSAGGLHVTGTGAAGSGGTIRNKTGADAATDTGIGIYLNNTADVQLNNMQLNDFDNFGIRGLQVNGFSLTNSVVNSTASGVSKNGTSNAVDEGSISFGNSAGTNGLIGTATITNTTIHDGFENGFALFNTSGTVNLVMDNVDVNGAGNDGIVTQNFGTATVNIEVKNSEFSANVGDHFNATADNGASLNVLFGNNGANTLTGGAAGALGQSITVQTGIGWSGNGSANIANNTITGAIDTPINVNIGGTGTFNASIVNNIIGANGVAGSGTPAGGNKDAIRVVANGDKATDNSPDGGTLNALISGNTIQQVSGRGIYVIGRDGGTAADPIRLNVTIIGNTLRQSLTSTGQAILLESGASSAPISDFVILHADIGGAGVRANNFTDDWGVNSPDAIDRDEIRIINTIPGNRVILTGYGGGATDDLAMRAYLAGRNTLAAGGVAGSNRGATNSWETGGPPTQPISADGFVPLPAELYELPPEDDQDEPAGEEPDAGGEEPTGGETPAGTPNNGVVVDDGVISQAELDLMVEAAIDRWEAAGATAEQLAAMRSVSVSVTDLAGLQIGESGAGTIKLDINAAGWSWFVDATPDGDSEYSGSGTQLAAVDGNGAAGTRIDLLSVVMHELGHQIGLSDSYAGGDSDELMYGSIGAGERRLPGADDASGGGAAAVSGGLAVGPFTLGTLGAGHTLVVKMHSQIDFPAAEDHVADFVRGATTIRWNVAQQLTSTPVEATRIDSLSLGNLVYLDVNKDGLFNAGDTGIAGVKLTLFADTNGSGFYEAGVDQAVKFTDANANGKYDAGVDLPWTTGGPPGALDVTTETDANGNYSFGGLTDGDYIVRIDASNFDDNAALDGKVTGLGEGDPNGTVDHDDNGRDDDGAATPNSYSGFIASAAIRLDYNAEPANDADADTDTNTMLDFGFEQPNIAPTSANLDGDTATWNEGDGAIAIDQGTLATFADVDSLNYAGGSLAVAISAGGQAEDSLGIATANVGLSDGLNVGSDVTVGGQVIGEIVAAPVGTIKILFDADATDARVATLASAFTYANSGGDDPTDGDRTVSFTLIDGGGQLNGGLDTLVLTATVDVDPVNDAPTNGTDADVTAIEDVGFVFLNSNIFKAGFADVEGHAFSGIEVTAPGKGKLLLDHDGNPATAAVEVTTGQIISATDLDAGRLSYKPVADENGADYTTFTFKAMDDGGTSPGVNIDQTANTVTIDVTAVNDAPVIDNLQGDSVTFAEDSVTPVLADGGTAAAFSDVDSANFGGGTLSVAFNAQPGDLLVIVPNAAVTVDPFTGEVYVDDGGTPVLVGTATVGLTSVDMTLTAAATPALLQQVVGIVHFQNTSNNPSTVDRTFTWTLTDGDGGSTDTRVVTSTVEVTASNDAPVVTASAGATEFEEGVNTTSTPVAVDPTLTIDDPDDTALSGATASFTGTWSANDTLAFTNDSAASFGNISGTYSSLTGVLTLSSTGGTATLTHWQNALRAVTFTNSEQEPSTTARTVEFQVNDGDVDSLVSSKTVNVTANNDAPSGTSSTVSGVEDQAQTISIADFGFADVVGDGDSFKSVTITSVSGGTLYLDPDGSAGPDAAVAITTFPRTITAAELALGDELYFVPSPDHATGAFGEIKFKVTDDGGTAGDGVDTDPSENTLTIDFAAQNDAPVLSAPTDATVSYTEDAASPTALLGGVTLSDPDSPTDFAGGNLSISVAGSLGELNLASGSSFSAVADGIGGFDLVYDNAGTPLTIGKIAGIGTTTVSITGLTAEATDARLEDLFGDFVYHHGSQDPAAGDQVVTLTFNDGGNDGAGGAQQVQRTQLLNLVAVNDEPVVPDHAGVSATEQVATALLPNISVSDAELDNRNDYDGASFTVARDGGADAADVLSVVDGSGFTVAGGVLSAGGLAFATVTGQGTSELVIDFTSDATVATSALVQDVLRSIQYTNNSDDPPASVTLAYSLDDGGSGGNQGNSAAGVNVDGGTVVVTITPTNDASVVDLDSVAAGFDATMSYNEDDGPTAIAPAATLTNPDAMKFDGATLTVSVAAGGSGDDRLSILTAGGIAASAGTVSYNGTQIGTYSGGTDGSTPLSITLDADADSAAVQALLRAVAFENVSDDPSAATREVSFALVDGDSIASSVVTADISMVTSDDAPSGSSDTATTDEASPVAIDVTFNDDDVDGPAPAVAKIDGTAVSANDVVDLASGAKVKLNADGTLTYDPNGAFEGTPAPISGASNTPATDSFTYELDGGTGTVTVTVTVSGLDNDDLLIGTNGVDILIGGIGNDRYRVQNSTDEVVETAGEGNDTVITSTSYTLKPGVSVEALGTADASGTESLTLGGNEFAQSIYGNAGNNYLAGNGGDDYLLGLGGADILDGGTGADNMRGGTGNDLYIVDNAGDRLFEAAGEGDDRVVTSVSYTLTPGAAVELLGTNNAAGTAPLYLAGNEFANSIYANAGDNLVLGSGGNDYLSALAGNDLLDGGTGADNMRGGTGNDVYRVDNAGDAVFEMAGEGDDWVVSTVSYTLTWDSRVETLSTLNAADTGALDLTGNQFAQSIYGNEGANVLRGLDGNDQLVGLGGDDVLAGGKGKDVLRGGAGQDEFRFDTAPAGDVDRIMDFSVADDTISLDDAIFGGIAPGAVSANAFHIGAGAHDADDRIIYNNLNGVLYYDSNGSAAGGAVHFATLEAGLALTASDFTVI
jgi:Ca2+-binding RTX toxin-like protein